MRFPLALCLALVFALAHPGGSGAFASAAGTAAQGMHAEGAHLHEGASAIEKEKDKQSCCHDVAGHHGKTGHCSIDSGYLASGIAALFPITGRVLANEDADRPYDAGLSLIPHPPRSV